MQQCSTCKTTKPLTSFYFRRDRGEYRKDCKACKLAVSGRYQANNKDKVTTIKHNYHKRRQAYFNRLSSEWRAKNKERNAELKSLWKKRNRGKANAQEAHRQACKIKATPSWLSKEHKSRIKEIYETCPKGYHVDHIVPLRGKNVSGLHVPWNLQHLPAVLNISKGNRL